jgi:hypothetical protein
MMRAIPILVSQVDREWRSEGHIGQLKRKDAKTQRAQSSYLEIFMLYLCVLRVLAVQITHRRDWQPHDLWRYP